MATVGAPLAAGSLYADWIWDGPYPAGTASGVSTLGSLMFVRLRAKQVNSPLATFWLQLCTKVGVWAPAEVVSADAESATAAIAAPPARMVNPRDGNFTGTSWG